ncbi:alpha-ketoglutarate decarboxylase [Croceitalea vernalis]|uniref:Alpha-ketoglutarate decarboxylase n=1 Tax=Croceitalea vernalis TaxID=3075599 RepID=A0ABU3BFM2_9FLAO|nr:alpha-ketoglutarate decarboxylase [Croceitalea sp. P007]MDT0620948.1 alpha-ketoglutarate decarboxylase [Croceitalea sp. P007]
MKSQFSKFLLQILSIFIFCCSTILNSQSNGNNDFWKDVQFGGGISLGFGNQSFNLGVSPSGIFQVNSDFATGLSLNFNYSKFGDDKLLAYGPSFINFYNPLPYLQLSGEFEQWRINIDQNFNSISIEDNYWYSALFFGIGYTQQNFTIGIRYDVLFDETRSLYADPWIPFVRFYF